MDGKKTKKTVLVENQEPVNKKIASKNSSNEQLFVSKKRVIVTSALPYVNNIPHLGNLVCVLSADVFARFLKLKNFEVISVLGTDEHGTTSELKALQEGKDPKQVCDEYFKIHTEIYKWFLCEPDCYGRTSSEKNHEITKHIFLKLYENGFIKEGVLKQPFCKHCNIVLADRFVIGTCPYCGYEKARGDQCDNCGKLLDPEQLLNPKCAICGSEPVFKEFKHLFLDLPKLQPLIESWFNKKKQFWSENAVSITKAWLQEGLKPRCITRNLNWGVKVPLHGFENLVFYSWFDAPIGYISIVAEHLPDWQKWWKNPEEVLLVQFMGKDNIPFHTVMFPGMLLGTKEGFTTLDVISANEYLTYEGRKFSKSLNIGVFGDSVMSLRFKPDVWRFYLMINRPEKSDSMFTWQDFKARINNELIANFANLAFRITKFFFENLEARTSLELQDLQGFESVFQEYDSLIKNLISRYENAMFNMQLRKALITALEVSSLGNKLFQDLKPWDLIKKDVELTRKVLTKLLTLLRDVSILMYPFIPGICEQLWEQLNIKKQSWSDLQKPLLDHTINKPELLVEKISDQEIKVLKQRFSGVENQKQTGLGLEKQGGITHGGVSMQEVKNPFAKLDLRVAKVVEVKQHPNADRLYVLTIDLGFEKRQLVAGLKQYYKPEQLQGENSVIIANLKPARIRGLTSNGMLLAVVPESDGKIVDVGILKAPNSKPGDVVFVEGVKPEPAQQVTVQFFKSLNIVGKQGRVLYNDKPLQTSTELVSIDKQLEGPVS
ncbi:methionine--tRNA ligase [Candidatus Woesearchaeota archaeon]|nr:methionine--tRNA ligase [Candidatus Woesearchaeota archaeon]